MATQFTDADFQSHVASGVTLVDFWAEWCGPCRLLTPVIEELSIQNEGIAKIGKVDVDTNPETSTNFGIRSIPTILIFKDGKIVDKVVGFATQPVLQQKIDAALALKTV